MANVNGYSGLTALAGYSTTQRGEREATPEERNGGPVDPRHGNWGEQAAPYPWQSSLVGTGGSHGPYGPENQLLDDWYWAMTPGGMDDDPGGEFVDQTPNLETRSHGAPWPKGIASGPVPSEHPDRLSANRIQSAQLHGIRSNADASAIPSPQAYGVQQDDWVELWNVTPGNSDLPSIPKGMMSSGFMFGSRDRTQSMAAQNQYGFDSAHVHRRYATGAIPGNTMWMKPGGRPVAKSVAGVARPAIGPDSPFEGDNLGAAFDPYGAVLQNLPTEYVAPAQPALASVGTYEQSYTGDDAIVEYY